MTADRVPGRRRPLGRGVQSAAARPEPETVPPPRPAEDDQVAADGAPAPGDRRRRGRLPSDR